MNQTRFIPIGLACTLVVAVGCEKKTPPPPTASAPSTPLGGLSQNPTSIPGKSAAMARRTAQNIEAQQAQEVGMAQEISGEATSLKVEGMEFHPPSGWEKTAPANAMQAAAYKIKSDAGEAVCVFFAGIGGDMSSNVERWKRQVTDPSGSPADAKVITRTVAGMKVTTVSMSGTYAGMASGVPTPVPGQGFRGAIIEAPGGAIQVRLTGPEAAVEAATPAWETMVLGMRKP